MTKTRDIRIATPCSVDWESMNPRATGRFCGDCKKVVHDLSSLGEAAAKRLLASAPAELCVRYLHDEYGNVWFRDTSLLSPANLRKKAAGLAALAVAPLLTACMGAYVGEYEEPGPDTHTAQRASPEVEPSTDAGRPDARNADAAKDGAANDAAGDADDGEPDASPAEPDAGHCP
jgi:hypothetical protein